MKKNIKHVLPSGDLKNINLDDLDKIQRKWTQSLPLNVSHNNNDRKKIIYLFRRGRSDRLKLIEHGGAPEEILFGMMYLDQDKYVVDMLEGSRDSQYLVKRVWKPIEKMVSRRTGIGFLLHLAIKNLDYLRQASALVSTVDSWGLPLAALKSWGMLETPLIYTHQGLSDRLMNMKSGLLGREWFSNKYIKYLRNVDHFIVLGQGALKPTQEVLKIPAERISFMPYGIDNQFWTPGDPEEEGDYILSVGSDPARDYSLLIDAVEDHKLRIITRKDISGYPKKSNVEISTDYSDCELRDLFRKAKFVVTPLMDVTQPSGQSATLQAMACGKAVILTDTRGLWDLSSMRHLQNCYLVKPGDSDAMRHAIKLFIQDKEMRIELGTNAVRTVNEAYNARLFSRKIQNQIDRILA